MGLTISTDPAVASLVSLRKLEYLLGIEREVLIDCANRAGSFYQPFAQRKIRGQGKWRLIDNPKNQLKVIQTQIKKRLLSKLTFPETILGGVPGKSTRDNAEIHTGQPIIVTIDLRDCFPKTGDRIVFHRLKDAFQCSSEIASLLTKLTTFQHRVPQGAPTSNAVVNLVLLPLHDEIKAMVETLGLKFSIYVDDITISGPNADTIIDDVIKIIQRHGYAVRNRKVTVMRSTGPQEVVGYLVNQTVSVARPKVEAIRKAIVDLGKSDSVRSYLLASLKGRINYVRSVTPSKADGLDALLQKVRPKRVINMSRPNLKESFEVKSGSEFLRRINPK
jgi:RNA-directed DNA polymerase